MAIILRCVGNDRRLNGGKTCHRSNPCGHCCLAVRYWKERTRCFGQRVARPIGREGALQVDAGFTPRHVFQLEQANTTCFKVFLDERQKFFGELDRIA
ncbi:hypothetical protein D9M70_570920 [compost metagenome]